MSSKALTIKVQEKRIKVKKGLCRGEDHMANEVGKRYVCKKCGVEFIVTRGGKGELHCCGKPMELKK